ncbi:MAG: primosomal protein N' [Bdellovibrionales bacterium]|nr:primosomal protein N' [Bdellovibrionales bacterium]
MTPQYFQVAVNAPLSGALTYTATQNVQSLLSRGISVQVPLGKRMVSGVILDTTNEAGAFELKDIETINEELPLLHEAYLQWVEWMAKYYMHPIGQILASTFPPLKKKGRSQEPLNSVIPEVIPSKDLSLTQEQDICLQQLLHVEQFQPFLLHGVTGSGKTEVYMQLLKKTLARGKSALILVPEISLTPQLIQRFASRFKDQIAVIHSHLTPREKTQQWWSVIDGEKKILIGARSALFCPIKNLGVIIVDEEHEPSFKQEEKLKYHARDASIVLAKTHNCPIVLGSATPSLESWQNAKAGKYQLLQMKNRVNDRKMPDVEIIDLKSKKDHDEMPNSVDLPFWLSKPLYLALQSNLENKWQSALFLNRRGTAQMALCTSCGSTFECPNCSISLTLHGQSHLVCHYCDYSEKLPEKCHHCESGDIEKIGLGTELVENDIFRLFPHAKIARADRDEIGGRKDLEELIENMESGNIDILIGTQMIAKGLDFPKLTLVGLVLADVGFNLPDFRATERSFQLLTQVSGRAGRHVDDGGKVFIQTFNPEHPSIVYSKDLQYELFADMELRERQELLYPPFGRLALFRLIGNSNDSVEELATKTALRADHLKKSYTQYEPVQVLGPCPAPIVKIRNNYRHQLLLKCPEPSLLQSFCYQLLGDTKWLPAGTKVQPDIDPVSML